MEKYMNKAKQFSDKPLARGIKKKRSKMEDAMPTAPEEHTKITNKL